MCVLVSFLHVQGLSNESRTEVRLINETVLFSLFTATFLNDKLQSGVIIYCAVLFFKFDCCR